MSKLVSFPDAGTVNETDGFLSRFSLIPAEGNPPAAQAQQADASGTGIPSITNILQRLWGQSGTASPPTSPGVDPQSPPILSSTFPSGLSQSAPVEPSRPTEPVQASSTTVPSQQSPTSGQQAEVNTNVSSGIPDDYRERHRQRERQMDENA